MKIFSRFFDWQAWRAAQSGSVGFVPTMGNLHAGHASLVKASLAENDQTVVSIFVNPTQFNSAKDFETYPKTWAQDVELLESQGVSALWAPLPEEMYPQGFAHKISRTGEAKILCDAHRPGHFDGVLTVVAKLLAQVKPAAAYFGEKDYQQLAYIRAMAQDFFFDVAIKSGATLREPSGLAMSSRNNRLSPVARKTAAKVYEWISVDGDVTRESLAAKMQPLGMELEYLEEHWGRRFVAFWLEGVRLIDNVPLAEQKLGAKE